VTLDDVGANIDTPTLVLLFALMIVSAQFAASGFFDLCARVMVERAASPAVLLFFTTIVCGALTAILANDIVLYTLVPLVIAGVRARGLDPRPFLIALAGASNAGSAATLIGNPQNMLIGEKLRLSFSGYLREAAVPVILGIGLVWAIIAWRSRGNWTLDPEEAATDAPPAHIEPAPRIDRWQTGKGLAVAVAVFVLFLLAPVPREVVALTAAGVLMMSRRLHSRKMLGLVDWQLLVLFIGLFVVNHALERTGLVHEFGARLAAGGVDLHAPFALFLSSFVLSNIVSNVPAVMLLLPVATHELAGPLLALASTLAGNLLIVGSIANIIVVEAARGRGIRIDWKRHALTGVPVTLATMTMAWLYLWLRVLH